jgi:hypothetical protein
MRPDLGSVSVTLTLPLQMAAWVSHDATHHRQVNYTCNYSSTAASPSHCKLKARLNGQQGDYWVARFVDVPETLQDALDRAVFRWHRRHVQTGQTHAL